MSVKLVLGEERTFGIALLERTLDSNLLGQVFRFVQARRVCDDNSHPANVNRDFHDVACRAWDVRHYRSFSAN